METKTEVMTTVYKNGVLVAVIKRDDKSRKHLIHVVKEAKTDDIIKLIGGNELPA